MNDAPTAPWQVRWRQELAAAEAARAAGNEGKARVCARRAAGVVIQEYLKRNGLEIQNVSAYEFLRILEQYPGAPKGAQRILTTLLVRVNADHSLPIEADLIVEARRLGAMLLGAEEVG